MKYRSLSLCLSILVMAFTSCSSSQQSVDAQVQAAVEQAMAAEHARAAEEARAAEQVRDIERALAEAEQARAEAASAVAAAKRANSAEQARAAAEAQARADAEYARLAEEARIAGEQAKAAEEARIAAEEARISAEEARTKAKTNARQERAAKQTKAQTVTLAAGTSINVITSSEISTQTVNTGDRFTLILNEDITDGDRVVARRGSTVRGVISESDPGGRVRGVATMSLTLTGLTLANGNEITINTNDHHVEASSSVGKDVAQTGIGAGIGAAIGAIAGGGRGAAIGAGIGGAAGAATALATHGNPAVIAPETAIRFNLTAPLTVTLQ